MPSATPMSPAQRAAAIQAADDQATAILLNSPQVQPMFQLMPLSQAIGGNNVVQGNTYNFNLVNVGLNRRVILEVTGTIAPANGEVLTATPWSIMNLVSNVTLTDLSNYQRINTKPRHLFAVSSARKRGAYGASFLNDSPIAMGNNMAVMKAPRNVNNAQTFRFWIELPLAYGGGRSPLRGAIWANVTGGTWRVQLTFNQNPVVGSAATNTSEAAYQSSTANDLGVISNINVNVYQDYLDQIPPDGKGGYILPTQSLAYNYEFKWAPQSAIVANTNNPVNYTNFRTFLSTIAEYDNGGVLNPGTDVSQINIQVANQAYTYLTSPFMTGLLTRGLIGDDFPPSFYYLDHREKPIITNNVGNTQLIFNPTTANAPAVLNVYWEMLSVLNQVLNASSLPGT